MGIEFKTLEQFMPFWVQKILPAVYDDSLSYYQLLGRILQKYNELIEVVNSHSETLIDHETRITANEKQIELNRQQIEALKQALAELTEQVNQNTENIAKLKTRVDQHDADILALQNAVKALQANNKDWYAVVVTSGNNIHQMQIMFTTGAIDFADWGECFSGGNVVLPLSTTNKGSTVGTVAFKVIDGKYYAHGCIIEDNHLHYFTATYAEVGFVKTTGKTSDWTEVELLDITNIKQSLGTGEYDVISQKVLTQILNGKLSVDMGISGATAGNYINIAEVDGDGKPIKYGFGTPGGGGAGVDVVQTTGQSTTSVMSQKATTDAINNVSEKAQDGVVAMSLLAPTMVYPTTSGGTDGKFLDTNGITISRTRLLMILAGADGHNTVFTVKKTGATSWDRITWFQASKGEGLYDFAWYETNGIDAKAGVDRLTMATNGQFAVSEQSSVDLGGSGIDISLGVTGAAVGDFIRVKSVSSGKPTAWERIRSADAAQLFSETVLNLGTINDDLSSSRKFTLPIPTAWLGMTHQALMETLSSGCFSVNYSGTYDNTVKHGVCYLRNGYTRFQDASNYRSYGGIHGILFTSPDALASNREIRVHVWFASSQATLSNEITTADELQCTVELLSE